MVEHNLDNFLENSWAVNVVGKGLGCDHGC